MGDEGTPHLQITIVFLQARTFGSVKKELAWANSPHIEACQDLPASIEYCQKDGDFVEVGDKPVTPKDKGQMEKDRWIQTLTLAKEGRIDEIDPQIQVTQCRNLEYVRCKHLASLPLADSLERNEWYCGPTGTGKSKKARMENPDAYLKMCNKWWDHYDEEAVVLLEDFDKKHEVLGHHLKIWGDRYPFLAEIKNGTRKIRPLKMIVTSNYHPKEIWTDPSDLEPILRRFHVTNFYNEL